MARYIDAGEALIMMQHSKEDAPYYGDWYMAHDSCIDCVNTAPTADVVEVKHGKWKKQTFIIFDSEKVGYHCSECNTTWDVNTNFCPNCGAKMDGKDGTK